MLNILAYLAQAIGRVEGARSVMNRVEPAPPSPADPGYVGCSPPKWPPLAEDMDPTSLSTNDRFDRLQALLLRLSVGDQVRPGDAARQTGLTEDTCRSILRGLERAGLMTAGQDDSFVRCRLE